MKKLLSAILLITVILSVLCLTVLAADDFVGEDEFTIASFNGINTYIANDKKTEDLETAATWLAEERDALNLKYVSFLGQIATKCKYTANEIITKQGLTLDALIQLSLDDPDWNKQYKKFAQATSILKDMDIPMGVSLSVYDYVSSAYDRSNLASAHFGVRDIMPETTYYDYLDDNNYCIFVTNNNTKYIIFQLELFPRAATLDWFKKMMDSNQDRYAIVCTTSFIDATGLMYTMWDWNDGFTLTGTTELKSYRITHLGNPRDGEGVWNYAFDGYDNILAIISDHVKTNDIVATKFKNSNGIEVAAIAANADMGRNTKKPTVLMTKISADNKEITCAWAEAYVGVDESTAVTVNLNKIGTLSETVFDPTLPKIEIQSNGTNKAYIFGYEGNTFRPNANMTRAEACTIFARLILGTQNIPDGYVTRFTDVNTGDWFYNAVAFLDQTGYFFRNKSTEYKPNEPITRAEFVDLANNASKLSGGDAVEFNDVPKDHFYYMSITAAASSGLVNGYEDGTFRPDKTITRAEVVTVINRLLGLNASERAISVDNLENVFVDIGTHWAKLNVLMASNSNVHSKSYYAANLDGVTKEGNEFVFTNKHFSFSVNSKNGMVTKIINLATGEDVNSNAASPQFIYLTTNDGSKILPTKIEIADKALKVSFRDGIALYLLVDINDNYMTFEIESYLPSNVKLVTFANLMTNLPTAEKDSDFMLNAIGMTYWTNPVNKGYRPNASSVIAHAYTIYKEGTLGAKLGVVFADKANSIKYLQEVTDAIDPTVGLTSKAGGAYATEWEGNYGDYAVVTDIKPERIDENIKLALEMNVDQYDIHQGPYTFRQGDFYFPYTENGTAKEYYETTGKKFEEAGIETGLHTYVYYIDYAAENILSNPKWQKDLETLETYTLRGDLSKTKTSIKTYEDATAFDMTYTFFYKNSRYIRIDNEIILVGLGTDAGFINCKRAQCGTEFSKHTDGATIYHLSGYFQMFVPKFGSDLFYHIADLTAKTYNEGGFDMLYLDAIDGINRHIGEGEEVWYWYNAFVHRVISQCNNTPTIEMSATSPQEWNVRGRMGAWDTASRSIKKNIQEHIEVNKKSMQNNMMTTLGWFSFFPDLDPVADLKNTIRKSMFTDTLDALGMGALLYDMSVVYNPFETSLIRNNPYHYDSIMYYVNNYAKLRKSDYFKKEVIDKVKSIGGEWKVIEKSAGEYAFLQTYYEAKNLTYGKDYTENTISGNNPFSNQTPFIRIESRVSTLFENPVTVYKFDESKDVSDTANAVIMNKLPTSINMLNNMAMTLNVKGTGVDGDAMLVSIVGGAARDDGGGRTDFFIDLNFEGWREVILLDAENAEYDTDKYPFTGIGIKGMQYGTFRVVTDYNNINTVYVRTTGNSGHTARLGEMKAYTHTLAPVKNPTITIGSTKMTFNCEIKGGEFLEYDPLTNKATLYHNYEQTKENVTFSGKLEIPTGSFEAVYSANATTNAPVRARVVLGFYGQEIGN